MFSLGGWARRIHTGFHVPRATRDTATLHLGSDTGLSPSAARLSRRFSSPRSCDHAVPQPRTGRNLHGLGYAPFARRYWGYHVLFSLPPATKMFQFTGFASPTNAVMTELHSAGLPHSDIRGSQVACTSPRLFAACHVLRRLPEPQASAVRPLLLSCHAHDPGYHRCSDRDKGGAA